jgi:hypothetical protein
MTTTPDESTGVASGGALFARYAYPPNALGYCGPGEQPALLARARQQAPRDTTGTASEPELRRLARSFAGAWPYLEAIAYANGLADPLEAPVVEAYWVGNELLANVTVAELRTLVESRMVQPGSSWPQVAPVLTGGLPAQHGFHVVAVYPWLALLGRLGGGEALRVLDRCRIRWGEVESVAEDTAEVRVRPLRFDRCDASGTKALVLGAPVVERATISRDGRTLAGPLAPGDLVSLHWDWVCDRLSAARAEFLAMVTAAHLDLANRALAAAG